MRPLPHIGTLLTQETLKSNWWMLEREGDQFVLRCKLTSIIFNYTSPLGQSVCLFIMVKYQNIQVPG